MWNLEEMVKTTFLQGSNRHTDVENKHGSQGGSGWVNWEIRIGSYTLFCAKLKKEPAQYRVQGKGLHALW